MTCWKCGLGELRSWPRANELAHDTVYRTSTPITIDGNLDKSAGSWLRVRAALSTSSRVSRQGLPYAWRSFGTTISSPEVVAAEIYSQQDSSICTWVNIIFKIIIYELIVAEIASDLPISRYNSFHRICGVIRLGLRLC